MKCMCHGSWAAVIPGSLFAICQPAGDAMSSIGTFSSCSLVPGLSSSCSLPNDSTCKLVQCQAPCCVWWITKGRVGQETRM